MPPSGYSTEQARFAVSFLRSCAEALEAEYQSDCKEPLVALQTEITQIQQELAGGSIDGPARGVLQWTLGFYESLANLRPGNHEAFQHCVGEVLEETTRQILAIHIVSSSAG